MGVRVVFPDMGKDPSIQLIEKTITENGTYDALTDGANGYSKVNVNVEGGGGSSDFSTAEVTVNGNGVFAAEVASLTKNGLQGRCTKTPTENSFIVVLYQGKTIMREIGDLTPSFIIPESETNIVYDEDRSRYVITGDCTITIS